MKIPFTNIEIFKGMAPDIKNVDLSQPVKTRIITQIIERQIIRTKKDIQDWMNAVNRAESVLSPSRTELMTILKSVMLDGHINGIINSIKNKIKAKEFLIVDKSGKENEDKTKLLKQEWFFNFIDFIVESEFFGYSLIELGDIKNDGFPNMELIPREYVIPEWELVKKDLFISDNKTGFRYNEKPLKDWFIFVGKKKNLGLLNIAAPHALSKKSLFASAWQYAELFGMPLRKGHTNIADPERRKNMETMLENMGSAAWGVFNDDDKIDFVESSKSGSVEVFSSQIKLSNEEISKAFAGQVGVFDEKSFVGSAEVQERLFNEFILSFMRLCEFTINNKLMPIMERHKIFPSGLGFKWEQEETLSVKERAEIIKNLSPFYIFTADVVSEQIGIPVENNLISTEKKKESILENVKDLYKGFIENKDE